MTQIKMGISKDSNIYANWLPKINKKALITRRSIIGNSPICFILNMMRMEMVAQIQKNGISLLKIFLISQVQNINHYQLIRNCRSLSYDHYKYNESDYIIKPIQMPKKVKKQFGQQQSFRLNRMQKFPSISLKQVESFDNYKQYQKKQQGIIDPQTYRKYSKINIQGVDNKQITKDVNNNEQKFGKTMSWQSMHKAYPFNLVDRLLQRIQLIDYESTDANYLQLLFKKYLKGQVSFDSVYPNSISQVGDQLIKDGIFHQMWSKVCKKLNQFEKFDSYYQKFYPQLTRNFTNFQQVFNQDLSQSSEIKKPEFKESIEQDSTRLTDIKPKIKEQKAQILLNDSSKENRMEISQQNLHQNYIQLISIVQTNQRRLNAKLVCYFLGITHFYNLIDIQIGQVLQFYQSERKQLLILQAFEPSFEQAVGKEVITYNKPKVLISMYGYVNFSQLLRIKHQYQGINGFILYQELFDVSKWLEKYKYIKSIQL